jgi:hypothetical protein
LIDKAGQAVRAIGSQGQANRPPAALPDSCRSSGGAPAGIQQRIELGRGQEAFQAQGPVLSRTQLVEFFGLDPDMLAGAVLVAAATTLVE